MLHAPAIDDLDFCPFKGIDERQDTWPVLPKRSQARPSDEIDPTKGRFLPFVKTLPRSFDTVPLIWELSSLDAPELEQRYDLRLDERPTSPLSPGLARKLVALLPPKAKDCAFDVESRFKKDWLRVKQVLTGRTDVPLPDFSDFCIAWLNVNSRCVYYDIGAERHEDNFTMAPIIDLMNHCPGLQTVPTAVLGSLTFASPSSRSTDEPLRADDELCFSYGPHEDAVLLTEYGFVLGSGGNRYDQVYLDDLMIRLFEDDPAFEVKRGLLQDHSYWREWSLTREEGGNDAPRASWRLLIAARLLHLSIDLDELDTQAFRPWLLCVNGMREDISPENERRSIETVRRLAAQARERAARELARCQDTERDEHGCLDMVKELWQEEYSMLESFLSHTAYGT